MRPRLLSLVAFSLTASAMTVLPPATAGDLYKWTDDKGRVHYSSTPPPESVKKAATLDSRKLSNINALPNDPHKDRADGGGPNDDSNASEPETPIQTASSDSAPASPPVLIPPSLLPPSNPPTAAKPEQPAQPDIVEVVAQGMGIDANAALLNAYSNAVQQALGLYVDAETMVQNDQIVQDKILTYSKGFIQEATTVKKSQANGLFQVNIRAKVKRQQLLEQAKANNISVKAVEGVSLHAQIESQIKQEGDAKALLEKALLPLMDATFLRTEVILPATLNKEKTGADDKFVTLDYKFNLWIDEPSYYNYIKSSLLPVLDQVAIRKGGLTVNYEVENNDNGYLKEGTQNKPYNKEQEFSFSILEWRDKGLTVSKWRWFAVLLDNIPQNFRASNNNLNQLKKREKIQGMLCKKAIELSLLDEKNQTIALGDLDKNVYPCAGGGSTSPIALHRDDNRVIISPYFSSSYFFDERLAIPPKSRHFTISVKISKEDLPRVKNLKLEVVSDLEGIND